MNAAWCAMALNFVKAEEGLRLVKYQDEGGNWTIGYGHRCGENQAPITAAIAERLLLADFERARSVLDGLDLLPAQAAALLSLVFNIGGAAFQNSTLRRRLVVRDYEGAAQEFVRWVYVRNGARMVVSRILVARRARERLLFLGRGGR